MAQAAQRGSSAKSSIAPTLVLSFDIEDWNQTTGARVGQYDWDKRGPAFERQMRAIFSLLDQSGWKATFFLLGMTIKHYPEIIQEIVHKGHEIACHGYWHEPTYRMTRDAFRSDIEASIELITKLCGKRPMGYRAPYFSINRDCIWAFELIAEYGFSYDSSQYDTPWVSRRIEGIPTSSYRMHLPSGRELIEIPVVVWKLGQWSVPIGGGSYWRVLPAGLLSLALRASGQVNPYSPIYFHPYEYDPEALHIEPATWATPRERLLAAYLNFRFNACRDRILHRIQCVARHFEVTTYECVAQRLGTNGRLLQCHVSTDGRIRNAFA